MKRNKSEVTPVLTKALNVNTILGNTVYLGRREKAATNCALLINVCPKGMLKMGSKIKSFKFQLLSSLNCKPIQLLSVSRF